ncbi:MAG: hypothetical protein A2700_00975 [Candidatus Blackburnbacteria bacterium RIFCSPHIGHO2_01_FULL_44_64]|uniref:LytR/CpsA/Psr regulator C-terminal domain-containing protein n=2 Tax=Microgenomates group TaxID=1794810 RepID=A0A0G1TG99_9BACT|nr:MAG: hypothetical protein UY08_C0008G0009 [Candidatus Gottesmanbacteria bacterium GW2011_GWA1_47_8]OGY08396.1 MAG: hypothetical protein A2700_00975 [Candidatus Blackburnbacteria bacterium RIFCSPHIGHO2_01_FULL_44_64]OGY10890.1 MAG: hypothetical protein A3E16_03210 [Candidatus Blackburnbacteria bacterium RIFCSPHIGHO2_12_FULL_44_25]OGY10916.1 MAG: hypothetical protein A3D26_01780 [Candidatus Blackburnbacteria bacterium RIFCSPHIGHO2_02_FULL_44_20]OGY13819.1 MAG: hypothetical protein A3A62_00685 
MPRKSSGGVRSRKVKRHLPSFLGPLIFVVLLFVSGYFAVRLYGLWENRLGRNETRVTVVVASEDPVVYSYNPQNESVSVITIPRNTQVVASGGYGNWFVGSLWGLGIQEKKQGRILQNSVQKSLGIPIDAWVGPGGEILFNDRNLGLMGAIGEIIKLNNLETNLSFFDKVNLLVSVGRVGRFSRNEIPILKKNVLVEETFSDGVEGYEVVPERTVTELDSLRDDKVFAESKTLRVNNASGVSGLANEVSRVVSILGLRVISTENAKEKLNGEICVVSGKVQNLESVAGRRLAQIYKCRTYEVGDDGPFSLEITLGDRFVKEY